LPAKGVMSFDTADLEQMAADGTLGDVITHEMGHVLGIGSIWQDKGLLRGAATTNPTFSGAGAMAEYAALLGVSGARQVPVENTGGVGTRGAHWRETVFWNELMSGFIDAAGNPISRVTVASLADLGYQVDIDSAEPYALPNLLSLAEAGKLNSHLAPNDRVMELPTIPHVLGDDALIEIGPTGRSLW
jgi:hypothetical protein